jgi:ketosteroid isomerase-like protein
MRDTGARLAGVMAAAVVAAALAGCGGDNKPTGDTSTKSDNETAVKQVMADLQAASRAGDGNRICTQIFTPKLADSVTTSAVSGSCAKEVKAKLFSAKAELAVQNVDITDAANATATVKEAIGNTSTVFLVKQGGRWRIRSVEAA